MYSPGAPSVRREIQRQFWKHIATGITSKRAAEAVGVAIPVIVISGAGRAFSCGFDLKAKMESKPEGAKVWRAIRDVDSTHNNAFL